MRLEHLLIFSAVAAVVWFLFLYYWPGMLLSVFKQAILARGWGMGPVPLNSLSTEPASLFADPIHPPASAPRLATTGVNRDTLLTVGWLDLSKGPQVLRVPEMDDRYYSVQFTDPRRNTVFAYVGTRTTGTRAGSCFVTGPRWSGTAPEGSTRISAPGNSVLVVGRVLVHDDADLAAAHTLTEQITLTPATR